MNNVMIPRAYWITCNGKTFVRRGNSVLDILKKTYPSFDGYIFYARRISHTIVFQGTKTKNGVQRSTMFYVEVME